MRFSSPLYIAIAGLLVAIIGDFIFTKLELSIYNSKFLRSLVEKNIDAWSMAGNLVPVIISLTFFGWLRKNNNQILSVLCGK